MTIAFTFAGTVITGVTGVSNGATIVFPDLNGSGNVVTEITIGNTWEGFYTNISLDFSDMTGLTTIGANSFSNVNPNHISIITAPVIPNTVTTIGTHAFSGQANMPGITLSTQLNTLTESVFQDCFAFTTITIPASVTIIDVDAFQGCSSLDNVIIQTGSQLEEIRSTAFDLTAFENITIPYTNLALFTNSFGQVAPVKNIDINISVGNVLDLTISSPIGVIALPTFTGDLPSGISSSTNVEEITLSGTVTAEFETQTTITVSDSEGLHAFTITFIPGSDPAPCLLSTSSVLTVEGYKQIGNIKAGDKVVSSITKQPIDVLHCGYNVVNLSTLEKTNLPMRIPKGHFSETIPSKDVLISGHHRVMFNVQDSSNHVGIQTFKLHDFEVLDKDTVLQTTGLDEVRYYHIEVEGGKNAMFCDGLSVETLESGEWNDKFTEN